jgi:hypothetical protein
MAVKRKIKLMPDYRCFPLWSSDPGSPGNIDPSTLPLSAETVSELERWAQAFDKRMDLEDPTRELRISPREVDAFEQEGVRLWKKLREELPSGYEVSYRSMKLGRLFTDPSQFTGS